MKSKILVIATLVLGVIGCDSAVAPPDESELEYSLKTTTTASVDTDYHAVSMDSLGWITSGTWWPPSPNIEYIRHIFASGLWLYADLDKPRANMTFGSMDYRGNYSIPHREDEATGIFVLTEDSLNANILNWPQNLGAPSTPEGQPTLFGDVMAWGFFDTSSPNNPTPILDDPIEGLDLGISVYLFNESADRNLLFIRYDVMNNTGSTISDLHAGFHSDTDLVSRFGNDGCNTSNATGYDETLALSYTYAPQTGVGDPAPDYCKGVLAGYMFLQSPVNGPSRDQVLAHTIIRKNVDFTYPGFDELSYTEPRHIGMALKGLSSSGDPMIDPSSGLETKFAFSGDPVSGTGWLDSPQDIRSLLSLKPFTILPGETKSITVVWIIVAEANLEAGLTKLKAKAELIQQFPDQYLN